VQPDGSSRLTYRLGAENVGPTLIRSVSLVDDLASAFAGATVDVVSLGINAAPTGFGASVNSAFTGSGSARSFRR